MWVNNNNMNKANPWLLQYMHQMHMKTKEYQHILFMSSDDRQYPETFKNFKKAAKDYCSTNHTLVCTSFWEANRLSSYCTIKICALLAACVARSLKRRLRAEAYPVKH